MVGLGFVHSGRTGLQMVWEQPASNGWAGYDCREIALHLGSTALTTAVCQGDTTKPIQVVGI